MFKIFSKFSFFGKKPKLQTAKPVVVAPVIRKGVKKAKKKVVIKKAIQKPLVKKVAPLIVPKVAPKFEAKPLPKTVAPAAPVAPVAPPAPIEAENTNQIIPIIYPYNMGSEAAKLLASTLKTKRVSETGGYVYRPNHLIINYGNKRMPNWGRGVKVNILNPWDAIQLSSNKLTALRRMRERNVSTIQFTENKNEAIQWVNDGAVVFCRTILNGYSGHGIVVAKTAKEIVDAPLYCVYKKSIAEYRVIVVNGSVIDFMQKKRKSDFQEKTGKEVNGMVRNHDNGWIFARNEVTPPKNVLVESVKAVEALGLNFAGVDVIFNKLEGKAYVLECNTALGLQPEGTTLKRLSTAFAEVCKGKKPTALV